MTGNNKFWRASLAGLASVAMLATMGVTALTASAATAGVANPKLTLANGSTNVFDGKFAYGDSAIDALAGIVPTASEAGKVFLGWYGEDGKAFDFTKPLTADAKATAKFANPEDVVAFDFGSASDYGYLPTGSTTVYVFKGQSLDTALVPADKAGDGAVAATWQFSDTSVLQDEKADTLDKVAVSLPKDGAGTGLKTVRVSVATTKDAKTLRFNGNSNGVGAYALNAWADGSLDDDLFVDVPEGVDYKAPAIVTTDAGKAYTTWRLDPGTKAPYKVGASVPVKDGNTFEVDPTAYDETVLVKFDSNGGSKVDDQSVTLSYKDASGNKYGFAKEPKAPTKDGYTFKGWKAVASGYFDFANTPVYASGNLTLVADWVPVSAKLKVTFVDQQYDGRHADESVLVDAGAFLSKDQAPKWTRDGYTLKWYTDQTYTNEFDFNAQVAGDVNGGDFTLYAKWTPVDEADAEAALRYVIPAGAPDVTLTQTTPVDTNGDGKNGKLVKTDDSGDFTDESAKEFEAVWLAQYKKFETAKYASVKNEVDAKTAGEVITALQAAWEKLQFKHDGGLEPTAEGKLQGVHRLYSPSKNEHFYSNTADEIRALTFTQSTSGNWNDEGVLFYVGNGSKYGVAPTKGTTPIVKEYIRFYNPTSGDHVWTLKGGEEYKTLAAAKDWNEEGTGFYTPTFTGSVDVVRFYNPALNRHVLSTSEAEQAQLIKDGWNREGVSAKGI